MFHYVWVTQRDMYVAYVENVTYLRYMLNMVGLVTYNLMLSEDISHAQ